MSKEAMKLALEALEEISMAGMSVSPEMIDSKEAFHARQAWRFIGVAARAMESIKQELAQQQEPVAWVEHEWSGTGLRHLHFEKRPPTLRDQVVNPTWTPLYTFPPAQRKPLTGEDIWKFWWSRPEVPDGEDDSMEAEFVAAVRRVLAAHGIKENT